MQAILIFLLLALPSFAETYGDSLNWQHSVRWRERSRQVASVMVKSIPDTSFPYALVRRHSLTTYAEAWIFGRATLQCAPVFSFQYPTQSKEMEPYIRWADCGGGILQDTTVVIDLFGRGTGVRPQAVRALAWEDSTVVVVIHTTIETR